jgi:hypothetical protein
MGSTISANEYYEVKTNDTNYFLENYSKLDHKKNNIKSLLIANLDTKQSKLAFKFIKGAEGVIKNCKEFFEKILNIYIQNDCEEKVVFETIIDNLLNIVGDSDRMYKYIVSDRSQLSYVLKKLNVIDETFKKIYVEDCDNDDFVTSTMYILTAIHNMSKFNKMLDIYEEEENQAAIWILETDEIPSKNHSVFYPIVNLTERETRLANDFFESAKKIIENCKEFFEKYVNYDFEDKKEIRTYLAGDYDRELLFNRNEVLKQIVAHLSDIVNESQGKIRFICNGRMEYIGRELVALDKLLKEIQVSNDDIDNFNNCTEYVDNTFTKIKNFCNVLKYDYPEFIENCKTIWMLDNK